MEGTGIVNIESINWVKYCDHSIWNRSAVNVDVMVWSVHKAIWGVYCWNSCDIYVISVICVGTVVVNGLNLRKLVRTVTNENESIFAEKSSYGGYVCVVAGMEL